MHMMHPQLVHRVLSIYLFLFEQAYVDYLIQSFIHQKMAETQNATMLNKEIKYNSSPTLTILFTKQSTPLYSVNCPTCHIYTETYLSPATYKFSNGFTVKIILTNLNNFL